MIKKISLLIKIIVSAALIYLVAGKMDFSRIGKAWEHTNFWYFFVAYLILIISVVVNSLKWQLLLRVQKIELPMKQVLDHYLVGYFFNNFFTGAGEFKRIYDLSKETSRCQEVTASVFMERWTGVITQVAIALVAIGCAYRDIPQLHTMLIVCGSLFVLLLLMFVAMVRISQIPFLDRLENVHRWLETFRHAYSQYMKYPGVLFQAFLLSLVAPVSLIVIHWLLTRGLGYSIGWLPFIIFIPIISVFSQIPVSINGIGVQELLFVMLLGIAGIPREIAFSISILSHLLKMGVGIIGGVFYFARKDGKEFPQDAGSAVVCPVAVKTGQ